MAEPCWFLAWTHTTSVAGSEKWLRSIQPLHLVVGVSSISFLLENNPRQVERNKTCKTQNSILGKYLTFVVWSSTVDCSLWVSGTPALGPMNSTHHQNNSSHHMECNSLVEKEEQGDLEKITRKREQAKEKCLSLKLSTFHFLKVCAIYAVFILIPAHTAVQGSAVPATFTGNESWLNAWLQNTIFGHTS